MVRFLENYSLKRYNTFATEVKAKFFFEFTCIDDLVLFIKSNKSWKNEEWFILGGGSNLLFLRDFCGLVFYPNIPGIEVKEEDRNNVRLEVGAGVTWDYFVEFCINNGWGGIENLSLIPGRIGAVPVQNIGAYCQEASSSIEFVSGIDLEDFSLKQIPADHCKFGYRDSIFKNELKDKFLIHSVQFKLSKFPEFNLEYGQLEDEVKKTGKPSLQTIRKAVIKIRTSKLPDPAILGNAGSFFKNPVVPAGLYNELKSVFPDIPGYHDKNNLIKLAAGWLIEQCGWKGFRKGDAGVHDKQALVLVNHGNATGQEIFDLSENIRNSVFEKFSVCLEREVICI